MRSLIPLVVDHAVKVRIHPSTGRIQTANVKMAINPFCEIAIEEAVQLKEKKCADEVRAFVIRLCVDCRCIRGTEVMSRTVALLHGPGCRSKWSFYAHVNCRHSCGIEDTHGCRAVSAIRG